MKEIKNIYGMPKKSWKRFCDWIESLPYSELITGKEND